MKEKTQLQKIQDHLKIYGSINTMEAFSWYRITRLSEYIRILRHDFSWDIPDEWIKPKSGNRYKIYKLKV